MMLHRKSLILIGCMTLVVALTVGSAGPAPADDAARIGTFDTRALAHAYANSTLFRETLASVHKEYEEAKARDDNKTMKRIEAEMRARQEKLHGQGFSTAPVDDILASYPGNLEELARAHGVSVIVSKWDLVWQDETARLVDLTDAMVQPYAPDERTLGWIKDMQEVAPVPMEDLKEGSEH
jgi:hypothetical protein